MIRPLTLNDIAKGVGIRVYCNACKSTFDPRVKKKKLVCKHPAAKQKYKSIIVETKTNSNRKRRTKVFDTRDLKRVVDEGFEFKNQVKSNSTTREGFASSKPTKLLDCLVMFMEFKKDVGVAKRFKKNLSKNTLSAYALYVTRWKEASEAIGETFREIKVDEISEKNLDSLFELYSKYSASTQKKAFGLYNEFFKFLLKNGYDVRSPFAGVKVSSNQNLTIRAVTKDEFFQVKSSFEKFDYNDKYKGRSMGHKWLADALEFSLLTGRRREEVFGAKFSDIQLRDGKLIGGYIKMIDSKYSLQHKSNIGYEPRYTKAPIYPELALFLEKVGCHKIENRDKFIIAPDSYNKRKTLANNLTNSFRYYRDKIGLSQSVQLKGLRKHYITRMRNEFGDNAACFTGHKSGRIDLTHYYDDKVLLEKSMEFHIW